MSADHVTGKVVVVTGAAGGFGRLVCQKAAAKGAKVFGLDVNWDGLKETYNTVKDAGGDINVRIADVTDLTSMKEAIAEAVAAYGAVDVMINNAGTMPLAFFSDHEKAIPAWHKCIDINIKGVLNGIVSVYDQMIKQGRGHVINLSSIYGNFPVTGAAVYGASKSAVNFLSESLRVESQGKIKVTIIKPTGVPGTGLGLGVLNPGAIVGIWGQNTPTYGETMGRLREGKLEPEEMDADNVKYAALNPSYIADAVITAIDTPWGVALGDVTVRAVGDGYIL